MPRLNKKLWSFNVGCLVSGSFIWLASLINQLPIPHIILSNQSISVTLYYDLMFILLASSLTLVVLLIMHKGLNVHSSEHTFWLVLPILSFLVLTLMVANVLILTMLSAAIPSLAIILYAARRKKERRIFDMEKALS